MCRLDSIVMESVNAVLKRCHLVDDFNTDVTGQNGDFLDGVKSQVFVTKASPQVRGHLILLTWRGMGSISYAWPNHPRDDWTAFLYLAHMLSGAATLKLFSVIELMMLMMIMLDACTQSLLPTTLASQFRSKRHIFVGI